MTTKPQRRPLPKVITDKLFTALNQLAYLHLHNPNRRPTLQEWNDAYNNAIDTLELARPGENPDYFMGRTKNKGNKNKGNKNNLEINKMLTLSIAHISEATNSFIDNEDIASACDEYGWIIYTFPINGKEYPEDLQRCLELARENNCEYLRIDREGEIISELQTFDWEFNKIDKPLNMKTIQITAHEDIIHAVEIFTDGSDNLLTDILSDSYDYEREEAETLIEQIEVTEINDTTISVPVLFRAIKSIVPYAARLTRFRPR